MNDNENYRIICASILHFRCVESSNVVGETVYLRGDFDKLIICIQRKGRLVFVAHKFLVIKKPSLLPKYFRP